MGFYGSFVPRRFFPVIIKSIKEREVVILRIEARFIAAALSAFSADSKLSANAAAAAPCTGQAFEPGMPEILWMADYVRFVK